LSPANKLRPRIFKAPVQELLCKENIPRGYPYPDGLADTASTEQPDLGVGIEIFQTEGKEDP
jgi:hypothetical protein